LASIWTGERRRGKKRREEVSFYLLNSRWRGAKKEGREEGREDRRGRRRGRGVRECPGAF